MKKLHPIRKMQQAVWSCNRSWDMDTDKEARVLARHVKPLLAALWDDHTICRDMEEPCPVCRLLAAWKEPL